MQFHGPLLVLCCVASALPLGQEGSLVLCSIRPSFGSEGLSEMESKSFYSPLSYYVCACASKSLARKSKIAQIRRKSPYVSEQTRQDRQPCILDSSSTL
eukprot:scaffold12540_cov105-Cylindrotheca_fusiformis.AAC.4